MNLDRVIAVRTRKIVYRDGEECIKVFDRDYSAADVLNEALNQARMEKTGLYVPKLRSVTMLDGKWAIVSEYIWGKTLAQRMIEEPGKRAEHLGLLVDLQCDMYTRPAPSLCRQNDGLSRKIGAAEVGGSVRQALLERLARMEDGQCICHGDLNPSNIILTWGGMPYIIDWSHASLGSPATDAARSCLYFRLCGQVEEEREYLGLFCRKSRIDAEDVKFRIPVVAAALSLGETHEKRERLLAWVNEEIGTNRK